MDSEKIPTGVWKTLAETQKPIIMYGMGDGAEKIMRRFDDFGIKPAGFMASDEFVRGHSFMGCEVKTLAQTERLYEDFIIVICFGSKIPAVMERIYSLARKYELYAPDVPVAGDGLFDEIYFNANREKFQKISKLLADDRSRAVLDSVISYKLTGDINFLKVCETPEEEAFSLLNIGKEETYVDLGAYNGDTVDKFLKITDRQFKEIYALEPDYRNFNRMVRRNYALGRGIFHPINAAAWSENTELDFHKNGSKSSSVSSLEGKGRIVKVKALAADDLLKDKRVTLMKLDVEGSEREALAGAKNIISRQKPKLILSVYHRAEDLAELPLLIKGMNSSYKLYLRHHPYIPAWDLNLYCV